MKWITSAGGPFLLVDEENLLTWGGVIDPIPPHGLDLYSPSGVPTDYDRACNVDGPIGSITVGDAPALVFGEEALCATWLGSAGDDEGKIVRYSFADSEKEVLQSISTMPETAFTQRQLFSVSRSHLFLFDSAIAGGNIEKFPSDYIAIELPCGTYDVATATYSPEHRMYVIVHRFVRQFATSP
jgi:hypothetical protein